MIQTQHHQVMTVGVFCSDSEKAEKFLKQFESRQLVTEEKTINMYFEDNKATSDSDLYKYTSLFQYAIYILSDLELSQKEWTNSNYKMLKLFQQYGYKQILLIYDGGEINEKDSQQELSKWITAEINIILSDYHQKEDEQNLLKLPIPETKLFTAVKQQDILQFFTSIAQNTLSEQQFWMTIINDSKNKKATAMVIRGYLTKGQTVVFIHGGELNKAVINNIVDYFSKKNINFARAGDVIDVEYTAQKEICGLVSGIFTDRLEQPEKQNISANIIFQFQSHAGYAQRFGKKQYRFCYYGQQVVIASQKLEGQLIEEKVENLPKQMTYKLYRATFKFTSVTHFLPQIGSFQFSCFNIDSAKEKGPMNFYGNMILKEEKKNQPVEQQIILIPQILTPAIDSMIINGVDFRQKCRVCRTSKLQYLPQECGHLRYCADCQDLSMEAKLCLYCDTPCTSMISLNIQLTTESLANIKNLTKQEVIDYFSNNNEKDLPSIVMLDNLVNTEKEFRRTFNCSKCEQLITHYQFCLNNHRIFLCKSCTMKNCETCNLEVQKKEIIYKFPDDPIQ